MTDSWQATGTGQRNYDRQTNHIELYRRPLRRAVPQGPSSDAAGTASGHKAGKSVPLRGKGVPPPNDKEWEFHPSKHFIPGKSFASSISKILQPDEGAPQQHTEAATRTAVRLSSRSYETHLAGGGVAITAPVHVPKPMRRMCVASPRTDRVLGTVEEDGAAQPTYALLGSARRDVFVTSRPTTAPACVLLTKTQTRGGYDLSRSAYEDVLQYRHSGGICPSDYKLVAERPSAPQLAPPASQQARKSFFDSRNSYNTNKLRSQMSDILLGN